MTTKSMAEVIEDAIRAACDMDASLNERLAYIAEVVRNLDATFADAAERMIALLREQHVGLTAPGPGDRMPSFLLPDERGQLVRLESLLEKGAVAISFNRGHWCPYCRLNTVGLVGAQRRVAAWGDQFVAIVPERQKFTMALQSEAQAPFPILTDMDNGYALSLNLAFWVGDEMTRLLADAGCTLPKFQGNETWTLPIPATFVVNRDGYVAARHIDPDYRKRMEIDALVDALAAARR